MNLERPACAGGGFPFNPNPQTMRQPLKPPRLNCLPLGFESQGRIA
jgi:hypothetical protein